MCFSATASFAVGAILFPAGIYGILRALKVDKHYLLFASIPLFFALQQSVEGIIWLNLHAGNDTMAHFWSYVYLCFAFAFWPFYFPAAVYMLESHPNRQKQLFLLMLAGAILGTVIYLPILMGAIPFTTYITAGSLYYSVYDTEWLIRLYLFCYLFILLYSLYITSEQKIKRFGLLVFISFVISMIWYLYAFTSVWCFFVAFLSLYIAKIMHDLRS